MADLQTINSKSLGSKPYIAGFKSVEVGLYADSLWDAKQIAVAHFKPNKRDSGLLWVELADESNPINLR